MSRNTGERARSSLSPIQRKACIVLACCALALIVTIVGVIVALGGFGGDKYDPDAYPVDTSLGAVLSLTDAQGSDYVSDTVFVGDQNAVSLYDLGFITLNQLAGEDEMKTGDLVQKKCVYFSGDTNSYTVAQALAKMKPRRVVVLLGANDADGSLAWDSFLLNYRQALKAINTAYPYCDVIVASVPPVAKGGSSAAERQQRIDQFNQKLAEMCEEDGYSFLNSAEALKNSSGYAESSYLDGDTWNKTGANAFLKYYREHALFSDDRRPDTDDVPQRSAKPATAETDTATPTPTPTPLKASYTVEAGKGTLTGNGESGVSSIEFEVESGTSVSVTAVPADGYTFFKWSDGVTDATRYDLITADKSVQAMFNDARVSLSLDKGDTTLEMGQSLTITATVKLGDKTYDNAGVQWSVNDDMQVTAGSYTFTGSTAGTYTIKAGIEVNGNYQSQTLRVTVNAPPTEISISGPSSIRAGESTTLSARTTNGNGDTVWSCDQKADWRATGSQVQFSANSVGTYTIRATNNGVSVTFDLVVTEAPTPTPTPTPQPDEPHDGDGHG